MSRSWRRLAFTAFFAAMFAFALLSSRPAQSQTFKVIYDAPGGNNVANIASHVITQGRDGDMYFTAPEGAGDLFKVAPNGTTTIVYAVTDFPNGGATLGTDGNYYVVNQDGGDAGFGCGFSGCGQIIKVTPGGVGSVIYTFLGEGDGSGPQAPPIQASNGLFYGTTQAGGANGESTVYSVTSSGTLTTLHSFATTEGQQLNAELVQGTDGNLYGMSIYGGANGDGSIFKITTSGVLTVLHNFDGSDGANPCCGLVQASDGNFYGSTLGGGGEGIFGVVFKITPGGTYTVLHAIDPSNGDGMGGGSTLTIGSDGKLYGVTASGDAGYSGTLFNITTSGTFTTLYTFCKDGGMCTDGYGPSTPVRQNTNGIFYGGTSGGGDVNACDNTTCGVVYSLNMGLKAFVSPVTSSGKEQTAVGIRGQGFSTSSIVKFGGVQSSKVTLSGSTFLTATVPAGAKTGSVTVTTGSTTLTSNQTFRITPSFTTFSPPSGPVGTSVTITGTGLAQATKVSFDGTPASFATGSDTEITATVPAGAKTGKITITTPGGTVTSTTNFTVN